MGKKDPRLEATYQMAQEILENLDHLSQASHKEKLRTIMEIIMRAERNLFLAQHPDDRANGYYRRSLNTASGPVPLSVPRDRAGQFRPQVLPPPYQRGDESYSHLLQALFSASYSPAKLRQVLKEMGLGYSQAEIERLKEEILAEFHSWQSRELSSDWIAIFIDAYHTEIQEGGKVRKATLYSVLGINFQGEKELLGLYIAFGNENKDFWLQVLSELVRRGLKRVLVVISDDFNGLREAVATIYPQAFHQLCFVHLQRNVRRNMARKEAGEFLEELARIKLEKDYDAALESFHRLLERFEEKYPSFIQRLREREENYLAFLHFPSSVRKYFYTINAVESFHSILEKMRSRMGGFFQSQEVLKVNVYLVYRDLRRKRWKKGIAQVRANLYSLRQMFALRYGELPSD